MVKVAVVTGANKGIGFAIVKKLCKEFKGDVYLTARNEERGKEAVKELEKSNCHPKFHLLDIEDDDSIKNLASFLKGHYGGLDVLVNNAAIAYKTSSQVPFGEQATETVKVNFFRTWEVCKELFPLLRPHARVVNVSSSAGRLSNVTNSDLRVRFLNTELTEGELAGLMIQFVQDAKNGTWREKGWANTAYQMSKVGLTALTFIQQRKFNCDDEREDLVVNAVHPGYVDTDMTSHKGPLTPEQGAEAPVYLALLPEGEKRVKGKFVWCDKEIAKWV